MEVSYEIVFSCFQGRVVTSERISVRTPPSGGKMGMPLGDRYL